MIYTSPAPKLYFSYYPFCCSCSLSVHFFCCEMLRCVYIPTHARLRSLISLGHIFSPRSPGLCSLSVCGCVAVSARHHHHNTLSIESAVSAALSPYSTPIARPHTHSALWRPARSLPAPYNICIARLPPALALCFASFVATMTHKKAKTHKQKRATPTKATKSSN